MESTVFGKCMPSCVGGSSSRPSGKATCTYCKSATNARLELEAENDELRRDIASLKGHGTTKDCDTNSSYSKVALSTSDIDLETVAAFDEDLFEPRSPTLDEEAMSPRLKKLQRNVGITNMSDLARSGISMTMAKASVLGASRLVQFFTYLLALAFVIFVLIDSSYSLGGLSTTLHSGEDPAVHQAEVDAAAALDHRGAGHTDPAAADAAAPAAHPDPGHRRLKVRQEGDHFGLFAISPLLQNIAFSLVGCGFVAFFVGLCKQPLILGYLLGGVLVGPKIGLDLVHSHESVSEISSLGLVFLLFMIGLELDVKELLKMGRVVLITGFLQFPICAFFQILFFSGLHAAGLSLGSGPYAAMYCGIVAAASSTMIVVKLLSESGETERPNGRLTVGILIFQDIWAMVFLAVQPKLDNPDIFGLARTFAMIAVLLTISMLYTKFVMPAVLFHASRSVELMLVLSLAWCFFMCVTAHLPWCGIGMELAALIAGASLATFPYSVEFNAKIKYIRDFFITLFFAALGMQIPMPSAAPIAIAVLLSFIILGLRWLGIFAIVKVLGGDVRVAALATINLSQISEFALVICSLGIKYKHIDNDTLEIIIWTFAILAIGASNGIIHKHAIYRTMFRMKHRYFHRGQVLADQCICEEEADEEEERDILFLGFQRIASMLVAEFESRSPELLRKLQVIDVNQSIEDKLLKKGVKFSYGDFTQPDVLHHAVKGEPRIVMSTTPDTMLQGSTNKQILKVAKEAFPDAYIIVTADNPKQAAMLYEEGASYVVRSAKLCAERLYELLSRYETDVHHSELEAMFLRFKNKDRAKSRLARQGSKDLRVLERQGSKDSRVIRV